MGNVLAALTGRTAWPAALSPAPPRSGGKELGARLLAFLIPVTIAVEVPGLGTIYLAELCMIGLLPVLLVLRGRMLQSKALAFVLLMGLVYLGAQIVTDVIRETPFGDYARGWSRILFFMISFVSAYLLIGNDRTRLLCFACGLVAGSILFLLINNPPSDIGWKFGFAGPSTTLMLIGFSLVPVLRSPRSLVGPMLMAALGVFSAFMDFRSWGGVLMVSAAFLSIPAILRMVGLKPKPLTYGRMAIMAAILLAAGAGALKLYGHAAEGGFLGEKSRAKYEMQSALGDLGILLGGRSESLVTVQAIQDSPLIGHGSWAKDRYYAELRQLMLYRLGFVNRFIEPENDLIPTHSHLLGAWVEAGLGGALFWAGVLGLIAAALRRLYASDDPLRPYMVFLMFLFIWDIIFSPFGAQRRLTDGFLLVVVLFAMKASAMNWRRHPTAIGAPFAAAGIAAPPVTGMAQRPGFPEPTPGFAEARTAPWKSAQEDDGAPTPTVAFGAQNDPDESADEAGFEIDFPDEEPSENQRRRGPTDIGAGGETIRAGFRRMRQRRR